MQINQVWKLPDLHMYIIGWKATAYFIYQFLLNHFSFSFSCSNDDNICFVLLFFFFFFSKTSVRALCLVMLIISIDYINRRHACNLCMAIIMQHRNIFSCCMQVVVAFVYLVFEYLYKAKMYFHICFSFKQFHLYLDCIIMINAIAIQTLIHFYFGLSLHFQCTWWLLFSVDANFQCHCFQLNTIFMTFIFCFLFYLKAMKDTSDRKLKIVHCFTRID